jgi:hypothetical protein
LPILDLAAKLDKEIRLGADFAPAPMSRTLELRTHSTSREEEGMEMLLGTFFSKSLLLMRLGLGVISRGRRRSPMPLRPGAGERMLRPRPMRALALSSIALVLSGCLGPVSLRDAVLGYDRTVSGIERELLLLNIARLRDRLPVHFTVTSNIAATFDYRISATAAVLYNSNPGFVSPSTSLGAMAAENPTMSIVPIQGREFTERVLTPMDEAKFEALVFQSTSIELVMRLMADGIEVQTPESRFERFILNRPTHPSEYEEFRRIALHLAWLNATRRLFVSRLTFTETTRASLSAPPPPDEIRSAVEKDYRWRPVSNAGVYELGRRVTRRVAITNYDPRTLTEAERAELDAKAANNPRSFVLIDIRAEHPGGDWPLFGALKLRSFYMMLNFVAEGGGGPPEYDVAKDPRTGDPGPNPARVLAIDITESAPSPEASQARFRGRYYSVANTPWDQVAFIVLYSLFQMTVTDVSQAGLPISISK